MDGQIRGHDKVTKASDPVRIKSQKVVSMTVQTGAELKKFPIGKSNGPKTKGKARTMATQVEKEFRCCESRKCDKADHCTQTSISTKDSSIQIDISQRRPSSEACVQTTAKDLTQAGTQTRRQSYHDTQVQTDCENVTVCLFDNLMNLQPPTLDNNLLDCLKKGYSYAPQY